MRRHPSPPHLFGLLLAALLPLLGISCTGKDSVRGDLVMILADSAPTQPSALFDDLVGNALTYEGQLDFPTGQANAQEALLLELLTGERSGQEEGQAYEWLFSLPQSAKLSGFRSLCVSNHPETIERFGMDEHFDYGLFPLLEQQQSEKSQDHGADAALRALAGDYEARGIDRAPTFFLADLTGSVGQLESTLAAIKGELYDQELLDGASKPKRQTLCILFTAPDSRLRALVVGPGIEPGAGTGSIAPRDFFPTHAVRGQIKVMAYLAGVVVPGFLSGRDLLNRE
ncbi:MAG: hypothetical protein ACI9C2_000551 [Gammaproteobacteria bacterium]|jgi:hypothetical protein